jgi:hypothetical protein
MTPDELREAWPGLDDPVIVYNKSHSGSRLVARLLAEAGVFMGAHRNASEDSLDVLALVESLVRSHYPDYGTLWSNATALREASALARACFDRHLEGHDRTPGAPWGWKLCETAYAMPFIARLFGRARVIHLLRDGRDVAFCDHRAPDDAFWRKVYFGTDRIGSWRGRPLSARAYRRGSHAYNAQHWSHAVLTGRAYGSMLGERYLEIRYEDLCTDFAATAARLLRFAGVADPEAAIARVAPTVHVASIGKHRRAPARRQREVIAIAKPALLALGYLDRDPEPVRADIRASHHAGRLLDRLRGARSRRSPRRTLPSGGSTSA